jgi:OmpA-OmpF porin, OOP family
MVKWLLALAAAILPWAGSADDPTRRGFDADVPKLALFQGGGLAVESSAVPAAGAYQLGAVLDLASGLLVLREGNRHDDLIDQRWSLHLVAARSLGAVELAAELPIVLSQRSDLSLLTDQGVTGPLVAPVASTTLGDLRLGAKVPLLDATRWPVGLSALAELRLPTGNPKAFASDGLALVPGLVTTRTVGPVRLDAQVGYTVRRQGQFAQLVVHDGVTYGLGASMDLPPLASLTRWRALAELTGGIPRGFDSLSDRYRAPLEAWGGLRAALTTHLAAEAGAGAGLGQAGYGHARWRVFVGVRWSAPPAPPEGSEPDRDGDGVPDSKDLCPDEPGPPELDGCPDTDGDGIPDWEDRCPHEPGPAENQGCPLPPGEPLVELEVQRLSLHDAVNFDTDRDTLKPESFPVLDQVARLLGEHPELTRIRVEGHTDNVGSAAYNKELSLRRANAVVRYLVGHGVAPARLVPEGYGLERPVARNETALGRARNRRVEFTILDGPHPP